MRVDVLTIFPGILEGPLRESLLGRAIEEGLVDVKLHDIRDFTGDKHRQVDDESYGGGPGMVLKPEPVFAAVEALGPGRRRTLLLSPAGTRAWTSASCRDSPPRRSRSATTCSRAARSRRSSSSRP